MTITTLVAMALALSSCGRASKNMESDDSKLQYAPELTEVETITLTRGSFPLQLISNGKLSATQRSSLNFRQGGMLTKVNYPNGASVPKGAVIAEIDRTDQLSALESARIDLERATLELKDVLIGLGYDASDISAVPEDVMKLASVRSGYSAAKARCADAERNLEATQIRAPFSGKVADIKLKAWETAGADVFCTMINDSEFDVDFTVLESEFSFLSVGQGLTVTLFGGDSSAEGRIVSINPTIDKNGQVAVKARIRNAAGMIDGMNVKVKVDKMQSSQLVVPKSAVVIRDGLEVLFRYNDGKAEWVYVKILQANSESYAVVANEDRMATLSEGDEIIISNNLNLADGSKVTLKQ